MMWCMSINQSNSNRRSLIQTYEGICPVWENKINKKTLTVHLYTEQHWTSLKDFKHTALWIKTRIMVTIVKVNQSHQTDSDSYPKIPSFWEIYFQEMCLFFPSELDFIFQLQTNSNNHNSEKLEIQGKKSDSHSVC